MTSQDGDQVFERAAQMFSLLSTPIRLRIVRGLLDGEKTVSQLMAIAGSSQPNLSQHLSTLYRSGLLNRRREGAHVLYRIAGGRGIALAQWMAQAAASHVDHGGPDELEDPPRSVRAA